MGGKFIISIKDWNNSNYEGYFSLVVSANDTLIFKCLGFKETKYIIPNTIEGNKFTALQILSRDIVDLSEIIIVPWNTMSEFKQAFVDLQLNNNDDLIRAQQNLSLQRLERAERSLEYDGGEMAGYTLGLQTQQNFNNSTMPVYGLTNPIAWYNFIDALRNGKLKNKRK
ncbi:MAG: hypothetical protein IPK03_10020 [Bacteroidetes bacterium]|nr:hypothetical protein [Bacteroidota bacterium]